MNSDLEVAMRFVLKEEGGYTVDPNDKGGETIFGISRVNWPHWAGWEVVDRLKTQPGFPASANENAELLQRAKDFYVPNFWQKAHCDELPSPLAIAMFDAAVNQGVGGAVRCLQIALGNLTVDGDMGDATKAAAFKASPSIVRRFLAQRMVRYVRTIVKDNSQEGFADNWAGRLMRCAELVLVPRE